LAKYLIKWNAGWGETHEVVEAETQKEADKIVYLSWLEEAEANAKYESQRLTRELAEEYGFEDELED